MDGIHNGDGIIPAVNNSKVANNFEVYIIAKWIT